MEAECPQEKFLKNGLTKKKNSGMICKELAEANCFLCTAVSND